MELAADERSLLQILDETRGHFAFRGAPIREMVQFADVAFGLQNRGLVSADVIYARALPDVVVVRLTEAGRRALARDQGGRVDADREEQTVVDAACAPDDEMRSQLACPHCEFTAPFRPSQVWAFRPREA
jgi:hypothetical protein